MNTDLRTFIYAGLIFMGLKVLHSLLRQMQTQCVKIRDISILNHHSLDVSFVIFDSFALDLNKVGVEL